MSTHIVIADEDGWEDAWEEIYQLTKDNGCAVVDARGIHWLVWLSEDGDTYARSIPCEGDEDEPDVVAIQGITLASSLEYPVTVLTVPFDTPEVTQQQMSAILCDAFGHKDHPNGCTDTINPALTVLDRLAPPGKDTAPVDAVLDLATKAGA